MSRKFDRSRQVNQAAFEILKATVKPKPRWMPKFVWMRMLQLIFR